MNTSFVPLIVLFLCSLPFGGNAQELGEYLGDESVLYSETKQVNQFFRRFNGEETVEGRRLYEGDSLFRAPRLRDFYLQRLFDQSSSTLRSPDKRSFIDEMIRDDHYLDFHGGEWVAEVHTSFLYQGVSRPVILYLVLEEAEVGSKWVFDAIHFEPYQQMLNPGPSEASVPFLHPMSHELDFMNLNKVFREPAEVGQYVDREFHPDYLTLFLYELNQGKFSFQTVNKVRFHFFQLNGWYFQINDIQRASANRGWLITQLIRIPEGQEQRLLDFIYRR